MHAFASMVTWLKLSHLYLLVVTKMVDV